MRHALRACCAAAILMSMPPTGADAQTFDQLIVFGDSLSDAGNVAQVLGRPSGTSYTTNPDPVWAQIVARHYGGAEAGRHSLIGGTIHAYAGACARPLPAPCTNPSPTTSAQIDAYLRAATPGPKSLYALWGGGNDLLKISSDAATAIAAINNSNLSGEDLAAALAEAAAAAAGEAAATADAIAVQAGRLRGAGARRVMVINLPDLAITPEAQAPIPGETDLQRAARLELMSQLTDSFNNALDVALRAGGAGVVPVNARGLTDEVLADPTPFGISNTTDRACGGTGDAVDCGPATSGYPSQPKASPETYMFADNRHPSGAVHAILADAAIATLALPVQISLAGEAGVSGWKAHRRALAAERSIILASKRVSGSWRGFARTGLGGHEFGSLPGFGKSPAADINSVTFGIDYKARKERYLGGAITLANHSSSGVGVELDGLAAVASAHGLLQAGKLYLAGAASMGRTSLDISRKFRLGRMVRSESGATGSEQFGIDIEAGWKPGERDDLFQQQLYIGLAMLNQEVEAYSESGGSATAMNIAGFERNSLTARAGWQMNVALGWIEPHLRLSWESEFLNDPVSVTAGSNSMAGQFQLIGYAPESGWITADLGLRAPLGRQTDIFAGYTLNIGMDAETAHRSLVGLRIGF